MLDKKELDYLNDKDFLLTKKLITDKIFNLLSESRTEIKELTDSYPFKLPEEIDQKNGKISKGENYRNLPYLLLDFPKLFTPKSIFAFRTMVWWGNKISFTLHLQGELLEKFRSTLIQNYTGIMQEDIFICVNKSTPWEYHFGDDNYILAKNMEIPQIKEVLATHPFIKISKKFPLSEIEIISTHSKTTFLQFLTILENK